MKKILVIMAIICGCTWFGGYVEAKDYTFKIINNHTTYSITKIRFNTTAATFDITVSPKGGTGQMASPSTISVATVELMVNGVWRTAISSFDDYATYPFINIVLNTEGSFSVTGSSTGSR